LWSRSEPQEILDLALDASLDGARLEELVAHIREPEGGEVVVQVVCELEGEL
jgi:hypothetical protein